MADMVVTTARPGLTPQIWDDKFFKEFIRENQFRPYMGTTENSIIQLKDDLTRKAGDRVTFAAMRKLKGNGVTGAARLEGNEEQLDARSMTVTVNVLRHAVAVNDWDEQKSVIDLREAVRPMLKDWEMEKTRAQIIAALMSIDGIAYGTATAGQRNTWLTNNADRVLFGIAKANNTGTFSTSLANIDGTNDKLSANLITLAKRLAKLASPAIRPMRISNGEEWFVMFANSLAFRDLKKDPEIIANRREALERGKDNPLFVGGDIIHDGVIVREIEELTGVAGAGASSIDVAPNYLCGAQALGMAWAQRPKTTTNNQDYGFIHGVGIQEIRGIEKLRFGTDATTDTAAPKDHGVFTVWASAVADA